MLANLLCCAIAARALQLQSPRLAARTSLKATRTEQILQHLESEGDGLGAGAAGTLAGLRALDARWEAMRRPTAAPWLRPSSSPQCWSVETEFE